MTPKKGPGRRPDVMECCRRFCSAEAGSDPCAAIVERALHQLEARSYDRGFCEEVIAYKVVNSGFKRFRLAYVTADPCFEATRDERKLHNLARLAWYALRLTILAEIGRSPLIFD